MLALAATLLEAALAYAARGWRIIPLYALQAGRCTCAKQQACTTPGKHPPVTDWVAQASAEPARIHAWWRQFPGANVGIVTGQGSGLAVIDTDPRHGGDLNLEELQQTYAVLPETPQVLTGGGGTHDYFACTEVLPSCDLAHGIQFQAEGRLVVAPPSLHASGKVYAWEASHDVDDMPLTPVPEWVRALALMHTNDDATGVLPDLALLPSITMQDLQVSARIKYVIQSGEDPDNPTRYPSRSEALFAVMQALIGGGHDDATIAAVVLCRDWRISEKPWGQRDPRSPRYEQSIRQWVAKEIRRARAKHQPASTRHVAAPGVSGTPGAAPSPGWPSVNGVSLATITTGITADWRTTLVRKKSTKEVLPNFFNLVTLLKHHPRWQQPEQRLWWDTIRDRHMCGDHLLTDTAMVELAEWLGAQEQLYLTSIDVLKKCLFAQCEASPRDLIQHWLHSLPPWDHTPRLATWLHDIVHIEDTPYTHEIARRLPVSMVARALLPGCQYREVIVLEGKENSGKSELVETLAGKEWYVVLSMSLETKESHMMLQRAWVAELAELDSLSRTEEARLKAFLTMKDDTYIPKYKNDSVSFPRRTVFIGTTNDETYLKGQTGNTRFLPIFLAGHIDIQQLQGMRDQLFAEAMVAFHAQPDTWWQMPDEVIEMASEERELRRVGTDYEQPLHEWLEQGRFTADIFLNNERVTFTKDETSWAEIATWFLKIETPERWKDKGLQMQIAATLKAIGWRSVPVWKQGRTTKIWQKRGADVERSSSVPF